MQAIDKIYSWLESVGYSLKWGKTDVCDGKAKVITINSNLIGNNKLYSLLHECGHVCLFNKDHYKKTFKSLDIAINHDRRHAKSLIYRYKKIKEEIDAWDEGYKLAKKLRIKINKKDYDKYAARYVHTYIQALADESPTNWDILG